MWAAFSFTYLYTYFGCNILNQQNNGEKNVHNDIKFVLVVIVIAFSINMSNVTVKCILNIIIKLCIVNGTQGSQCIQKNDG